MLKNRIKEIMVNDETNPCEVCDLIGVSKQQLYRYIREPDLIPGHKVLKALCAFYNEPPSYFISFTTNQ